MKGSRGYGRLSDIILRDIKERAAECRQAAEEAMPTNPGGYDRLSSYKLSVSCLDRELLLAEVDRLRAKEHLFDFELTGMRDHAAEFVAAIDKIMELGGSDERETWSDAVRSRPRDLG